MFKSGFKQLTLEEVKIKQQARRERQLKKRQELKQRRAEGKIKLKPDRMKTLKTKLWVAFSKYIRKSYADPVSGMVMTCDGKVMYWQDTDCGHLYNNSERCKSSGGNELWYYEHNFAPQSKNGNCLNADDSAKMYLIWAVKKYGIEEVEEMRRMKERPRKFTEEELQQKYEYYTEKFAKL